MDGAVVGFIGGSWQSQLAVTVGSRSWQWAGSGLFIPAPALHSDKTVISNGTESGLCPTFGECEKSHEGMQYLFDGISQSLRSFEMTLD